MYETEFYFLPVQKTKEFCYLKDLDIQNIYVTIISEDHGRALERIGATEVVFPERDLAKKLAKTLSSPNLIDYIPLSDEYNIVEIAPPKKFIGKTLAELALRNKHNISILGVRSLIPEKITMNPGGTFAVKDSDILIALGRPDDIEKITSDCNRFIFFYQLCQYGCYVRRQQIHNTFCRPTF